MTETAANREELTDDAIALYEEKASRHIENGRPVRVFLIEDHQVVREGTKRLLEMDGGAQVVGEASSGEDAINSPQLSLADVVLCDVILPGMDGVETTREVLARYPHTRVVMLSSFGDRYFGPSLEAGAAGYLLKRATQEELVRAVKDAANGGAPLSPQLNALLVDRYRQMQSDKPSTGLTDRQKNILKMVSDGDTTKQISDELFLSPATVKRELRHIFDVMGVENRAHAVAEAQRRGLI